MTAAVLFLTLTAAVPVAADDDSTPPNLVFILTDNHGPWTLGCYGNQDIETPHIDRLADGGVLFTRAFANNPVCSPTRATLLTGLMPCQHGVHCYLRAGGVQIGPQAYYTLDEFDTLTSVLVQRGYTAAMFGKWHLGDNLHPQDGFRYWLTKPHGASSGFYNQDVIENGQIRREPRYLTDLWTDHAVRFLEAHHDEPFFLLLSYNGPYGLGNSMREPIGNRFRERYLQQDFPSFPRLPPQPWNHNYADWIGDLQIIRKYAAEVSGVDDGVGRVLETLDRLQRTDNTIVLFIADQGLAGGHAGYWGMGDHTRPLTAFDWTTHIPFIVRYPGRIPAGLRRDEMVSNYDVLPTLLSLLGLPPLSGQPRKGGGVNRLPGRDLTPLMHGAQNPGPGDWQNVHFIEFENVRAVRTDRWKYIERIHESPHELYDLVADPDEHHNLYDRPEQAQTRAELRRQMHEFFDQHADPQWDLWHGGRSKSELINAALFRPGTP